MLTCISIRDMRVKTCIEEELSASHKSRVNNIVLLVELFARHQIVLGIELLHATKQILTP